MVRAIERLTFDTTRTMRLLLIFLLTLTLGACADPSFAPLRPEAAEIGQKERVIVMTNRLKEPSGFYGGKRSEAFAFLDISVSVPRDRVLGAVPVSYRRPTPGKHFVMTESHTISGRDGFRNTLSAQLRSLPPKERDIILFVHGFNSSFSDGVFRTAQLYHDFELNGLALHYSWPSIAHPLGYSHDRDSLLFARDGLETMLRDIGQSGARNVVLVGHSLGAMLVMETLRQMDIASPGMPQKILNGVVLVSPDIDIDLFKTQAFRISTLPKPFAIFVSQKDRALQLSSRINGRSQRLGTIADPEALGDLEVTVFDVTAFSDRVAASHFTVGSSPALIKLLTRSSELSTTFEGRQTGPRGGLPGIALTVRNATQVILSPGLFEF